ncbi:MAG: hypothetical protein K9M07_00035 [Simkaniaceae bacterium]|nr:hypothetical protein [Simkaniaceae bacterium]
MDVSGINNILESNGVSNTSSSGEINGFPKAMCDMMEKALQGQIQEDQQQTKAANDAYRASINGEPLPAN